jgi:hypothetical protein
MEVKRHYADVAGAYPIQRKREIADPDADLREAALRQGATVIEPEETSKEGAD